VATGEQHTVREFVERAGEQIQLDLRWEGVGASERGFDARTGKCVVEVDPRYYRPAEVNSLLGDARSAREKLGWVPKISFQELVSEMMTEDLKAAERDNIMSKHGYKYFDRHE
jgi:GDPmannose 4,6-dehydratase